MAGDVLILGGGSTGEAFAGAFRGFEPDTKITLVEKGLIGGECSYYACMPSKALLRPAEALHAARLAPGAAEAATGELDAARVLWHRDQVTGDWDDSSQEEWLADRDIEVVRAEAVVREPGVVEAGGRELRYERLMIATGSVPTIPPIDGLDGVEYWTNREATSVREIPASLVVLGAGPVGCELAQFYARMGAKVALADMADRLLPRDHPDAGAILQDVLAEEGIALHLGRGIERVAPGIEVRVEGGAVLRGERLIVATGRRAGVEGFGLEKLGVEISKRGIEVDERMRAGDGIWAAGDVTGIAMFTHAGKYQARVAAADAAGKPAKADHRAVPAVTFTDPQVASVGNTTGEGLVVGERTSTARLSTYERPKRPGFLKVFADRERGVLVGACAVGPEAGEWLGQLTLAIKAEVPVDVLLDTIQPYPTFSEAVFFAVRDLDL
ncbi:MAG TPA: NAD(P)/FAD-dependent oxidoreductase [Gaiellales bacterium]|nr:NAD(P)/FAD-dependent oxidoreductase [Gaiellales bacterium]